MLKGHSAVTLCVSASQMIAVVGLLNMGAPATSDRSRPPGSASPSAQVGRGCDEPASGGRSPPAPCSLQRPSQ